MIITKYDIFLANFSSQKGSVQSSTRPCVILQSNVFNNHSSTVLVAPLTTSIIKIFPSEFFISPSSENGLEKVSRFLGSQIVTIDKQFLLQSLGKLEMSYHSEVQKALSFAFDLPDDFI